MKRPSRFWLMSICAVACLLGAAHRFHTRPVSAQTSSNGYDDGNVYVYAYIDVDSNYYLYAQSYAELDPEADEDIDYVGDEIQVDQDGSVFYDEDADPDPELSEYPELESTSPVATGFEYGVTSSGYVCIDDGEGDCDWYPEDSTYASVSVASLFPTISGPATTTALQGGSGSITISGTHLLGHDGSSPTLNISGDSGVIFTLSGTPASTSATFNYSATNATVGKYILTVTTIDGTSSSPPTINFNVAYPPTTVTSISPNIWTAGQSYPGVQITGTNFGPTPTVSLNDPTIIVSLPYNTSIVNGASTTDVNLSVPATTPTETVTVTVTPGSGGSSFTQIPGGPSLPGSSTATVEGGPNSCQPAPDPASGFSAIAATGTAAGGSGTMTVSFSGGSFDANTVTVPYGQYSTPDSIASNLAARITQKYYNSGLSAQAFGPYVAYSGTSNVGTVNSTATGSSFAMNPSAFSTAPICATLPPVPRPCLSTFVLDYDTPYPYKSGTETPRKHITDAHINGQATITPPNTVYAKKQFVVVQIYNLVAMKMGPYYDEGGYTRFEYRWPDATITLGGVTIKGLGIGVDDAGNNLSTNRLVVTPACTPITSYPIAP
jgi:hypothetical protein